MPESFDTIVIGGGPGGYVAAIRWPSWAGRPPSSSATRRVGAASTTPASRPRPSSARRRSTPRRARAPTSGSSPGRLARLGRRRQASRQRLGIALRRREDALGQKQGDRDRGRGSLTAEGNVKVGDDVYEAGPWCSPPARWRCRFPGRVRRARLRHPGLWSLPELPKPSPLSAPAPQARDRFRLRPVRDRGALLEMLPQMLPAEDKDVAGSSSAPSRRDITVATGNPVENVEAGEEMVKLTYGDTNPPRSTTSASPAAAAPTPSRWAWPTPASSWRRIMFINLKTARTLGIDVPLPLSGRADEIFE